MPLQLPRREELLVRPWLVIKDEEERLYVHPLKHHARLQPGHLGEFRIGVWSSSRDVQLGPLRVNRPGDKVEARLEQVELLVRIQVARPRRSYRALVARENCSDDDDDGRGGGGAAGGLPATSHDDGSSRGLGLGLSTIRGGEGEIKELIIPPVLPPSSCQVLASFVSSRLLEIVCVNK